MSKSKFVYKEREISEKEIKEAIQEIIGELKFHGIRVTDIGDPTGWGEQLKVEYLKEDLIEVVYKSHIREMITGDGWLLGMEIEQIVEWIREYPKISKIKEPFHPNKINFL